MAVRYSNNTPVLKGRNTNDNVHPYKGITEKYSNYSIFNESNVLDVEPKTKHVVGEGPSARLLGRVFAGKEDEQNQPLDDPGEEYRRLGLSKGFNGKFGPKEFKGVPGDAPLRGDFGHDPGTPVYANGQSYHHNRYLFKGVPEDNKLDDPGHKLRAEGGAATFGRFNPFNHHEKALGDQNALRDDSFGMELPEGNDHPYGRNRVLEWNGVESDKAIF